MPNTRGNRPSGPNNSAEDLARVQRDKQIIAQRLEDVPLRTIAGNVGCALSTVQEAVKRWMAEHAPAAEQVEELRTVQAAQIDAMYAKVAPASCAPYATPTAQSSTTATATTANPSKKSTSQSHNS